MSVPIQAIFFYGCLFALRGILRLTRIGADWQATGVRSKSSEAIKDFGIHCFKLLCTQYSIPSAHAAAYPSEIEAGLH